MDSSAHGRQIGGWGVSIGAGQGSCSYSSVPMSHSTPSGSSFMMSLHTWHNTRCMARRWRMLWTVPNVGRPVPGLMPTRRHRMP
jgi:hypothetical protein